MPWALLERETRGVKVPPEDECEARPRMEARARSKQISAGTSICTYHTEHSDIVGNKPVSPGKVPPTEKEEARLCYG